LENKLKRKQFRKLDSAQPVVNQEQQSDLRSLERLGVERVLINGGETKEANSVMMSLRWSPDEIGVAQHRYAPAKII